MHQKTLFSPQRKSLPCRFRARKFAGFQRKLAGMAVGAGFRSFGKGKSATAQIENLRRDAWQGRYSPIPSCHKTAGEREEAGTFSHFRRTRRHVGWGGAILHQKTLFPPQRKSFPCSFRARKFAGFQRKLAGMAVGAGFRGFGKGKTATAQIENLRRDARQGEMLPRPSAGQKSIFDKL